MSRRSIDRRRFLHLIAAGGAAALAAGAASAESSPAAAPRRPRAKKPLSAATQRELENQRKSIADMLKVIRDYDLPPGSDLAVTFRPLRARREGR